MSEYPYVIRFVILLNILLFITFVVLSIVILAMRFRRDEAKKKLAEMEKFYYDTLLNLIFEDNFEQKLSEPRFLKNLLAGKFGYTDISKNALIDVIGKLFQNLSGDIRQRLVSVYMHLELQKHSHKKLSSMEWDIKVQGIKEIAMMGVTAYAGDVGKYINNSNEIVRREARLAFLQLDPKNLETFINKTTTNISYWEIINIIDVINSNITGYLESFSPRFDAELSSLVYFCLKITNYYLLAEYAHAISYLYMHKSEEVKILAIQTSAMFGNKKLKSALKERYDEETDKTKIEIIRAFKVFGDMHDISFLSDIVLNSQVNGMRFEAMKSLNEIVKTDKSLLLKYRDKDPELAKMVNHILDERII